MSVLDVLGRELSDGSVLFGEPVEVCTVLYDTYPLDTPREVVLPLPTANDRSWRRTDSETRYFAMEREARKRLAPRMRIVITP